MLETYEQLVMEFLSAQEEPCKRLQICPSSLTSEEICEVISVFLKCEKAIHTQV
jgi:hypothetical protein